MSSAVIVMRLHDKELEILVFDLPKIIMVLMYITNPILQSIHSQITHSPFFGCAARPAAFPGLCDNPPGLLRVELHTLGHIVPDAEGEIVKYSGTSKQDF